MKILVTDKMAEEALNLLKNAQFNITYDEMDHDQLLKVVADYDALMIRGRTKVTEDIIRAGSRGKLKVIGRAGIGVDNIDVHVATQEKIKVVNAPTGATTSVAELTIAHMLILSRHLTDADATMKKREWAKKKLKGTELNKKILGLIGTGNIGIKTACLAQAFNMKIIGYDPFISKKDMEKHNITKIEKLGDLMKQADYVSLHLPHNAHTHYIINEEMIAKMKPTAYLINCARGGTVQEEALYKALKEKRIAGAGLDVYETEPPVKNPILALENVILTPHLGANTIEGQIKAGTVCAEQVIKTLNGENPDYWINRPK